jgi:serine/threonine-protein kinase HipA
MTLTGHRDGEDASTGVSYLELARVLMEQGAQPDADLRELWMRIVFNVLVSNSDDHLRNHGFILVPRKGWRLSPAYDMNPVPDARGLRLNISEVDNALDLELVRSVAPFFRVPAKQAQQIIERCRSVVRQWPKLAKHLGVPMREQKVMASAFGLA